MVDATYGIALDPLARSASLRYAAGRVAIYSFLGFFALIYLLPLFVVVANSFRELPEITRNGLIALPPVSRSKPGRKRGRTIASREPARASNAISTIP